MEFLVYHSMKSFVVLFIRLIFMLGSYDFEMVDVGFKSRDIGVEILGFRPRNRDIRAEILGFRPRSRDTRVEMLLRD